MTYMQQPPPQGYYPAPAPRPSPPAYFGLGFIGWLLRLIGWFMCVMGIVFFAAALFGAAGAIPQGDLPRELRHMPGVVAVLPGIAVIIGGLFVVGFGEVYLALRDMARNSFK